MNKVINGILFTKMYIVHDDGVNPELCKWTEFALHLSIIETFYDITGINEMLENKTKLISKSNWEYIIDMTFTEFKEIFIKFRTETDKDFMKNIFLKTRN